MEDVAALPHETLRLEALQGVGAEAEPDRLEAEDRGRRDVPQVDVGAHARDEVALQLGGGRLEEQAVARAVAGQDLLDEPEPELTVGPTDPRSPALACLQRHQEGPGVEVVVDASIQRLGARRSERSASLNPTSEMTRKSSASFVM